MFLVRTDAVFLETLFSTVVETVQDNAEGLIVM
jgi:hypothetical protein